MHVTDYRIRRLEVPCSPPISDSQYEFDAAGVAYVELETDAGETGIGVGGVSPTNSPETVRGRFESTCEDLLGESPFHLVSRRRRPRGGRYGRSPYGHPDQAIDVALWDLCGKHLDMPLYRLFGGTDRAVPAYASGLHFSLDDEATRRRYERYAERGFDAAKVKVGYPTVEGDLDRLELVRDAMGRDPTLMVDANEAWSPKEAIRRAHAYRDAGFDIYWFEDPIVRSDVGGYRRFSEAVPFAHVNTGEYVDFDGKRQLLQNDAVDVLHLSGGYLSSALRAATLAEAFGVPVGLHDTICHVCVHLAAALPELSFMEYWPRPWDDLTDDGVEVRDGTLLAPDRPGHGITISDAAFDEHEVDLPE